MASIADFVSNLANDPQDPIQENSPSGQEQPGLVRDDNDRVPGQAQVVQQPLPGDDQVASATLTQAPPDPVSATVVVDAATEIPEFSSPTAAAAEQDQPGDFHQAPPEAIATASGSVAEVGLPGPRIPHFNELPLSLRQNLPGLELNVHVYDADPEVRFVLINMVRYQEGDEVGVGIYLQEINEGGIQLQYQNTRFLLSTR